MCLHFCSADRGMCWKIWTFLLQEVSLQPWRDDCGYGSDSTESTWQCRRCAFDPCIRKIPWRREWLSTPVFLPGEFHGQRSLVGYSPWGHKESDMTDQLTLWLFTHIKGMILCKWGFVNFNSWSSFILNFVHTWTSCPKNPIPIVLGTNKILALISLVHLFHALLIFLQAFFSYSVP